MYILGIETSCDDTACTILEALGGFKSPCLAGRQAHFKILANISFSQIPIHKKWGGVVPNLASRAHLEKITPVVKHAFKKAKVSPKKIDLIAVTKGPGLAPSLLVGINFARGLAYQLRKPVIGVNHIEGHVYSNWLPPIREFSNSKFQNLKIKLPALVLIVSGGHTELILMQNHGKYKILGQTLDDAAGETFDKTARSLGFEYPGGPAIAAEAAKFKNPCLAGRQENAKIKIALPRPMINTPNYNFSFSGLKTAVLYLYNDLIKKYSLEEIRPAFCAEIQQAIIDVLIAKTLKAAKNYKPKSVMLAGGVAANKKLREELDRALESKFPEIKYFAPPFEFTTDNAAMIAACGYFNYLKKRKKDSWKNLKMQANLKI